MGAKCNTNYNITTWYWQNIIWQSFFPTNKKQWNRYFISINKPLDKTVAENIYLEETLHYGDDIHIDTVRITQLKIDEHAENKNKTIFKPIYVNPNYFNQYTINKLSKFGGTELTITFFNPQNVPTNPALTTPPLSNTPQACPCPQPSFISRASWGCPDGNSPSCSSPNYTTVTHLVVHHEAGSNTATNWAARVLSIWNFHTGTNGWCDIGYNWLIDPNGVIYEGRGGGNNVVGAHFCGNNSNTMGVCFLGDYTSTQPSQAALNALRDLLAWKACNSNLNPTGTATFAPDNTQLPVICGHRDDVISCSTTCPGNQLYNQLPTVRTNVQNQINTCGVQQLADITLSQPILLEDTILPGDLVDVQVTVENIGGTATSPLSQLKLYRSSDCIANGIEEQQLNSIPTISPGGSTIMGFSMLTNGIAPGNYKLILFADQNQQTPESNENNNLLCLNLTVDSLPTPLCNYSLSPLAQTVSAPAGSSSFNFSTEASCAWSVIETCPWVTVTNNSGSGNATINFTYTQNTTNTTRTCTLTVAGQTHVVTQLAAEPIDTVIAELPVVLEISYCSNGVVALDAVPYSNIDEYTLILTSLTNTYTQTVPFSSFTFTNVAPGQYTATLIVSNSSDTDTLVIPNYINVVEPPVDFTVSLTYLSSTTSSDGVITINSNLTNLDLNVVNLDNFVSVPVSGYTASNLSAGDYLVSVCYQGVSIPCCADTTVNMDIIGGINSQTSTQATLYPNPTNGLVTLQLQKALTGTIIVYDAVGKLLFSQAIDGTTANLNLSGYAAGVYTLSLSTPNGNASRYKVLKW